MGTKLFIFKIIFLSVAIVCMFGRQTYAYSYNNINSYESDFLFKLFGSMDVSLKTRFSEYELSNLDIKLIKYSIEQFINSTLKWDNPSLKKGLLNDFMRKEKCPALKNWTAKTKWQLARLEEIYRNEPETLTYIYLVLAYRLEKVIKEDIPKYNFCKFRLLDAIRDKEANCVVYSIMFYVLAKEVGLSSSITLVTRGYNPKEATEIKIYHAGNIVYLPSAKNKKRLAIVDITLNNYVSYPIGEDSITVTKQDAISRWLTFDKKDSCHLNVREFNDYLKAIQINTYAWAQSVNNFYENYDLTKIVLKKMLSLDPNNRHFLRMLLKNVVQNCSKRTAALKYAN